MHKEIEYVHPVEALAVLFIPFIFFIGLVAYEVTRL